jgi:sec-independent protein translocase protein TatB
MGVPHKPFVSIPVEAVSLAIMPGFQDSAFIVILALLLFGPKKLPVLARQLGKLMADFRRASNEFRTQMEEELRISEQADRQKEIAAIEAAAPPTPAIEAEPEHPHLPAPESSYASSEEPESKWDTTPVPEEVTPTPTLVPIATSGELNIMPPSTGLPVANTSLSSFVDSIPEVADPETSSGTAQTPLQTNHEPALETETLHG